MIISFYFRLGLPALVLGAVLLMVGRSYVGNDVTHSTLLDRACACSYENLPIYRSYRVSNTAPWPSFQRCLIRMLHCDWNV